MEEHYIKTESIHDHPEIYLKNKKVLWGFSSITPIHLGFDKFSSLLKECYEKGAEEVNVIVADTYAYLLNNIKKEDLKIRNLYYKNFLELSKTSTKITFGSDFQKDSYYTELLNDTDKKVSFSKLKNSIPSIKKDLSIPFAVLRCPIMQCVDILYHNPDIILADISQKKTYDLFHEINKSNPVWDKEIIYFDLTHDIKGLPLNRSKNETRISIHETTESLSNKVKQLYAPPGRIFEENKVNAMLELIKYSVFPWFDSFEVTLETGDFKKYYSFKEFETDYFECLIHPNEAKKYLFEVLNKRLLITQQSIPSYLTNWIDLKKIISL